MRLALVPRPLRLPDAPPSTPATFRRDTSVECLWSRMCRSEAAVPESEATSPKTSACTPCGSLHTAAFVVTMNPCFAMSALFSGDICHVLDYVYLLASPGELELDIALAPTGCNADFDARSFSH